MNPAFIVIPIILIGLTLYLIFNKAAVIRRKLKKAVYRRIKDFRDGEEAKIHGRIIALDKTLIAPLSYKQCVWYRVVVEQEKGGGKSKSRKTIIVENEKLPFLIEEDEHYAYIELKNAKHHIVKDHKQSSGTLDDASLREEQFLNKHGHQSEGIFGLNKSLYYSEAKLEINERIAAYGKGSWVNAESLGIDGKYGRILHLKPAEDGKMYFTDDQKVTHQKAKAQREEKPEKRSFIERN